jgi:hypothetical protein
MMRSMGCSPLDGLSLSQRDGHTKRCYAQVSLPIPHKYPYAPLVAADGILPTSIARSMLQSRSWLSTSPDGYKYFVFAVTKFENSITRPQASVLRRLWKRTMSNVREDQGTGCYANDLQCQTMR